MVVTTIASLDNRVYYTLRLWVLLTHTQSTLKRSLSRRLTLVCQARSLYSLKVHNQTMAYAWRCQGYCETTDPASDIVGMQGRVTSVCRPTVRLAGWCRDIPWAAAATNCPGRWLNRVCPTRGQAGRLYTVSSN